MVSPQAGGGKASTDINVIAQLMSGQNGDLTGVKT